jgi:type IV pilus assembly protein PilQ
LQQLNLGDQQILLGQENGPGERKPFESLETGGIAVPGAGDFPSGAVRIRLVSQAGGTERPVAGDGPPADTTTGRFLLEVQNEDIRKVLELLARNTGLNILISKTVQGTVTVSLRDVDLETAIEALLQATGYAARKFPQYVFIGTAEECERIDQVQGGMGLRIYRPRFVSAKELESVIRPLLSSGVGIVTVSSPAATGITGETAQTGGDSYAGGDVVIVRDYETVLSQLDRLVREMDVKPPQVAIEAMILAVRLDDEDRLGINFELFRDRPRFRLGWENPPASLADIRFDAGLKVAFLDGSVASFVSALQQVRDTNVIAAPRLLVLNKHRADIQIGKEQGYVSTTITETAASQSVDFLQTGTLLRIRPFVLGERMVRLEVHPELSDGDVRELAGFTVPQKDITQVTTNVLVPDGATVVIGGLIRRELSAGGSQVPVLGNLPWIGAIFRNRTAQQLREEIIVLITPHIIEEEQAATEAAQQAERFGRQFNVAAELNSPTGRHNVAKRFARLAQSAWARGDFPRARRMAELALHFDPSLEEALAIREAAMAREALGCAVTSGAEQTVLPPHRMEVWGSEPVPVDLLPEGGPDYHRSGSGSGTGLPDSEGPARNQAGLPRSFSALR